MMNCTILLRAISDLDKITWNPTTQGTVTLVLLKGPSENAVPQYAIVEKTENDGSYVWTPSTDLEPTTGATGYGIQVRSFLRSSDEDSELTVMLSSSTTQRASTNTPPSSASATHRTRHRHLHTAHLPAHLPAPLRSQLHTHQRPPLPTSAHLSTELVTLLLTHQSQLDTGVLTSLWLPQLVLSQARP